MDDLVRLMAALKGRIDKHGPALRGNEALTRYALIDPLLRGLGWDTEDPAQVVPEYGIPSNPTRSADYALFTGSASTDGNVPEVIVEAKKLGTSLTEAAQQAVNYCTVDGFEYFVVTDGDDWQLFGTRRKGNLDAKRIVRFHVSSDATADACRNALALWRPGFVDGSVGVVPSHKKVEGNGGTGGKVIPPDPGWTLLSDFVPQAGTKPAGLKLPDGQAVNIHSWKGLMIQVAQWLVTAGKLSETSEPLRAGKRFVLAPQPKHPDGKDFTAPGSAGPLYVETSYSARDAVRHTLAMVAHAGVDGRHLSIRMAA